MTSDNVTTIRHLQSMLVFHERAAQAYRDNLPRCKGKAARARCESNAQQATDAAAATFAKLVDLGAVQA